MASWSDNIEAVARAVTAKRLAHDGNSEEKLAADVDMWWHLTAAELECGVIDETARIRGRRDRLEAQDGRLSRLDAPPSREPRGLGNGPVRSAATPSLR